MTDKIDKYVGELKAIFKRARDKHDANYQSANLMIEMSGDSGLFSDILRRHIEKEGSLNTKHYPVLSVDIELNEFFVLVANCWIPLPDKNTNISTKSIHHHGDMLLTTVTAFGPGYEHWTFETPAVVDAGKEIYELKLLEQTPHPLHHVAFVDAYIAHLPLYPPDLTVTYSLWSSRFPTTWKDKLKRMPIFQQNSDRLRKLAVKAGLSKQLELKVVEYFDFYPSSEGFRGLRERKEFESSNNEDYLASLFHIIQATGNEKLALIIYGKLNSAEKIDNRILIESYLKDLESGKMILGRLSSAHYGIQEANFTKKQILECLEIQSARQSERASQI